MDVSFVRDRDDVHRLFHQVKGANPQRIADYPWFREALTLPGTHPFAMRVGPKTFFLWDTSGGGGKNFDTWGGYSFVDQESYAMTDEEAVAFSWEVPKPFGSFASAVNPLFDVAPEDDYSATRLDLPFASYEEYENWAWSGKRRKNIRSELRQLDALSVSFDTKLHQSTFDWVMDFDNRVARRHGQEPTEKVAIATKRLFVAAAEHGKLGVMTVNDGPKMVAAEIFIADKRTSSILSIVGHGETRYNSIGKLLYARMIEFAIKNGFAWMDAMAYLNEQKKQFRYRAMPTYWIDMGVSK